MRSKLGRALLAALRDSAREEAPHAVRWLKGQPPKGYNVPSFKIVIRQDDKGAWWAVLCFGVLGYSPSDHNPLARVSVEL